MNKTITKAIESAEAQALLASGLKLVSTARQLQNGTIALVGTVRKQPVSYKITANGAVLSNEFVARMVKGAYPLQQYRAGLRAAGQLLAKRQSV
jgi:hypothetical protein